MYPAPRNRALRWIAAIGAAYRIDDALPESVGVSIGAVAEGPVGLGLAEMMRRADRALCAAKPSGKGRCILHGAVDAALRQAA